jgi:DNA-binding LytR/AlgR family response regulator
VADDDPLVCATVEEFLSRVEGIEFCLQASDGIIALNLLATEGFDVVFLDLHMPGLDGESLLRAMPRGVSVVVISASAEFGARSYEFDVADYLVKPLEFARFFRAVQRVRERLAARAKTPAPAEPQREIFVKEGTRIRRVDLRRLLYVKAESNYMNFVTDEHSFLSLMSLKKLEEMLPPEFVRIHRSFVVNQNRITKIDDGFAFIGKHKLPISDRYRDALLSRLKVIN